MGAQSSQMQKTRWLRQRLAPWQDCFAPLQAVSGPARWAYREKIRLTARWADKAWQFGLMRRDELIPIPRCPVHTQRARAVLQCLSSALPPGAEFPLAFYIQAGALATLVLKSHRLPALDWLTEELQSALARAGLKGLWLHLHPAAGRRMFAKNGWRLLWGSGHAIDDSGFRYGPGAFQQLIPALYHRALDEAEAFLAPGANHGVADLYCGIGASLARWLRRGAPAIGVELDGEALACARDNAPQAALLRGKCRHRIPQLQAWLAERPGALLYANPPRTGLEAELLDWLSGENRFIRMAYLSCSAGTLCRDLQALCAAAYRVERITPYDFFPQTRHVETLVLLVRRA